MKGILAAALALALVVGGCSGPVRWVGVGLLYDAAPPPERVLRDLAYRDGSELAAHRLDLYLPAPAARSSAAAGTNGDQAEPAGTGDRPLLVFVHGGGWTAGSKDLVVGGADVYGNIGRFFADRGVATAVVNYRLQPEVTWREQVTDVAEAVAWLHARAAGYGIDPGTIFIAGHSAGAQLATYVALRPEPLAEHGLAPAIFCGVAAVSGVAYDLADERTYELGADRAYYEARFRAGDPGDGWKRDASSIHHVSADAPPFLLIHGSREWKALKHHNRLLHRALVDAGAESRLLVARQTHTSIVLALSRDDKLPGRAILDFIRAAEC